jgi:hypothetical protein
MLSGSWTWLKSGNLIVMARFSSSSLTVFNLRRRLVMTAANVVGVDPGRSLVRVVFLRVLAGETNKSASTVGMLGSTRDLDKAKRCAENVKGQNLLFVDIVS